MQRHSMNRDAILDTLRSTRRHPSARSICDELRSSFPHLSQSTVYRLLNQLKEDGLVKTAVVVNGEERFDAVMEDHGHFVCTCCGEVTDLEEGYPDMERLRAVVGGGRTVQSVEFTVKGKCISCRSGG